MKITREHFPEWNRKFFDNDFELKVLLNHLEVEPYHKILEVGCNDTELSNTLHSIGCEVWGVDVIKNNEAKFKFIHGNFQDIELPESYFDIVIDISAIHHFGLGNYKDKIDPDADMVSSKKIYKVLKPNGLFYISMDRIGKEYIANVGNYYRQYNLSEFIKRVVDSGGFMLLELILYFENCYPFKAADPGIDNWEGKQLFALLRK